MEITGRVTRDATVNDLAGGKKVVNFNIALNDGYYSNKKWVEQTSFVEVAYWLSTGIAKFLTKGVLVQLHGRIEPDAYINKNGEPKGVLRFTPKANGIRLLTSSGKPAQVTNPPASTPSPSQSNSVPGEEDDLPF